MSDTQISAILTVEGLRKFQSDMDAAGDAVDRTGKRGMLAGATMTKYARAGFLAAGAAAIVSVKKFASFDDALNRVQINSGASAKEMVKLEKVARKMGERFPASAVEVADAMNEILKAGMSVEDMLAGGLENALAMATAEGMEMATAANVMSNAMNTFGVSGENAAQVAAALSNVASKTSADVNDLALSLGQVGGTADTAGWSISQTTAALGVLIQRGLTGSKAGTSLNNMLSRMMSASGESAKAMKALGIEVYDSRGKMKSADAVLDELADTMSNSMTDAKRNGLLMKAFGIDGLDAARNLGKARNEVRQLTAEAQKVDAPVQKARDQMRSLGMQLDTTGEAIGNMAMQIGGALAPSVLAALPHVQRFADEIGSNAGGVQRFTSSLIALGQGVGTVVVPPLQIAAGILSSLGFAVGSADAGVLRFAGTLAAVAVAARMLAPAMVAVRSSIAFSAQMIALQSAMVGSTGAMSAMTVAGYGAAAGMRTLAVAARAATLTVLPLVAVTAVATAMFTAGDSAKVAGDGFKSAAEAARDLKAATDELEGKQLSLADAELSAREATNQLAQARDAARKAAKNSSLTEAQREAAVLAVERAEIRSREAAARLRAAREDAAKAASGAAKSNDAFNKSVDKSVDLAGDAANEWSNAALAAVKAGDAGLTSTSSMYSFGSSMDSAASGAERLGSAIDSLPTSKTITVTVNKRGAGKGDGMATGGRVYGPGTGTSDSVPAMLSAGEWVLTAKQAKAIGYGTLAALPKFAKGGPVAIKSSALSGSIRQAAIDASPARTVAQATAQYNAALKAERGKKGDKLKEAKALTKQRADDLVRARQALAQSKADAIARKAQANAAMRQSAAAAIGSAGSAIWQQSQLAGSTATLDDDLAALRAKLAAYQALGTREGNQGAADTEAEIWTMLNVTIPAAQAAAVQQAIDGVGAKGSDLWKKSSLAATTATLDDDLAVLRERLAALQAFGPAAAAQIADAEADIWTMLNITMPQQQAQQQAQVDAWKNEAAMALGRGFYGASGGAGGGGSMGITDTAGGDASGVGHAPRPEVDRVWLAGQQLNDLDARSGHGCEVVEILGWDEAEDFESTRAKRADGDALGGTRDGSVKVVVRGRLRGSSYQDYHERRRALKAKVRAAVDITTLKVPDVTFGDEAGDYPDTYAEAMAGMERRIVRLTSNLKWGNSYGLYGSEWEFELRSPHRFVEADVAAEAPSGTNAAAMAASSAARTSILAIRGEIAAAPAMNAALKFAGTSASSEIAVRAAASNAAVDSLTKLADPADLPVGIGFSVAFEPSGTYLAVTHDSSPYVTIYKRSGDTFTKLANPASLPGGSGRAASFDPSSTYLAIAHSSSPYVTIYKRSGDTFTKLANPASLPTGLGHGVAFDPSSTYLAVMHTTSPYVTIYKRSGDTFTKLANPADLPAGIGRGAHFDPSGTYLAVAHDTSPYLTVYKRSGDTFAKLANPADMPAGGGKSAAFDPSGTYLAVGHETSPRITVYRRSGDTLTKVANPSTLPPDNVFGVAFDPSGAYLAAAHGTTPYVTIYAVAGSDAAFGPMGTLRASPPSLAISGRTDTLPVASADISSSQPLTSQDSFDIDTIAGTATPVHRTPLARLIGGPSFIAGIIPARYDDGPVVLSEVVTRSAAAGSAVAALGALGVSHSDVVNEDAVDGAESYIGILGALTADPAQVATGMPGWRAKRAAANFTASSYVRRRIDAALGQPRSRPVIHAMMAKPASSWATATTDLAAFGSGVTKFAHLLTLDVRSGGINYINAVGFYYNGTRLLPTCVRYDDKGTDGYFFVHASGALSITPDPSAHAWIAAILDAGVNVWNAIVLVDVNTGEPLMWFVEGHDQFDGAASAIIGEEASQAVTATTSGTCASNVAYPTAAERYLGCGSNTAGWAASVAGTTVPAGGMGAIVTLDAAAELFDHGITSAAMLTDASTDQQYAAISSSIVDWVRARFAPQSIRRDPIALEVEWTDRVPELHGEPIVRLDSVPASTTEQALGASRTGGLSTEQMVTAAAGGAGERVIEAREVR